MMLDQGKHRGDVQKPQAPPPSEPAGTPSPSTNPPSAKPAPKSKSKSKAKAKPSPKKADDEPAKDDDSELLKSALRIKAAYTKAKSSAEALVTRIEESSGMENMGWAKNPENLGLLQSQLAELHKETTDFAKDFFLWEPKMMKEKSGARWMTNLKELAGISPKIDQLNKTTKMLKLMKTEKLFY